MKRILALSLLSALAICPVARAHGDAATEERLNQLSGKIEDLIAGQEAQRKRISELAREVENLREQASKPVASVPRQEDLTRLADAVKEVDRKRQEDYEKTSAALMKISKGLASAPPPTSTKLASNDAVRPEKTAPDKGNFEYTIQPGDTLDAIVAAYKEKNMKITVNQIVKANPGLVPEKMKVGQKISIPAP